MIYVLSIKTPRSTIIQYTAICGFQLYATASINIGGPHTTQLRSDANMKYLRSDSIDDRRSQWLDLIFQPSATSQFRCDIRTRFHFNPDLYHFTSSFCCYVMHYGTILCSTHPHRPLPTCCHKLTTLSASQHCKLIVLFTRFEPAMQHNAFPHIDFT